MKLLQKRVFWLSVLLLMLSCTLCACHSAETTDTLYRLPKLPPQYESLEAEIDALLAAGAERTAPTSGSNLQSVQMVDLDGDGVEEAIAFFRKPADEKPMKIYFFRSSGESYEQLAMIEGTASSLYSITYSDLNSDGIREIFIGYKSGTGLQVLSVYALLGGEPTNLLTTAYTRYAIGDLDGDAMQEVCVLYSDENNGCMADCYDFSDRELVLRSTIALSFPSTQLQNVTMGSLTGGEEALFLTGVSDNSVAVSDVLTLREGVLQNITHNGSGEITRFLGLYPADINNDGITEIPEPIAFATEDEEAEIYYRIGWRQYSSDGAAQIVRSTFHNAQDGWDLILPEEPEDAVSVQRSVLKDETVVLFSRLRGEKSAPQPLLAIYTITGEDREFRANRADRFLLARQVDTLYAAELFTEEVDEQTLKNNFSLITAEWKTGEN